MKSGEGGESFNFESWERNWVYGWLPAQSVFEWGGF